MSSLTWRSDNSTDDSNNLDADSSWSFRGNLLTRRLGIVEQKESDFR